MKRSYFPCIVILLIGIANSSKAATDILNNLSQATHTEGEQFDMAQPNQRAAQAFTTDGNSYTLDSISAEFAGYGGASSAEISLWSDNSGFPGSVIETLGNVSIPGTGGSITTQSINSTATPTLAANSQYWVVISWVSGDYDFNYTTSGVHTGVGTLGEDRTALDGVNWGISSSESFKVAVSGTAVPATDTVVDLDASNNLIITDVAAGGKNDSLTISSDTTNSRFVIQSGSTLTAEVGTLFDPVTAHVPFASVTGGQIIVQTVGGDDSVTLDFSLGDFAKAVVYEGGAGGNDSLDLAGGGPFGEATHNFVNATDGSVSVDSNGVISYTGIDSIVDMLTAGARSFVFGANADDVTLQPSGGPGMILSSVATSQSVFFTNPTTELAIFTGAGSDLVTVTGLAPGFAADLIIDGEGDSDTINLNAASLTVDDLAVTAEAVELAAGPINSTGTQHYNGAVILMNHITIGSVGNLTFSGPVDGSSHQGQSLTLNCSGMTSLAQPVGANTPVANFNTDAPGSMVLPASVSAGLIFVRDPTTLSVTPTTTLTGSTGVVFVNTLDGQTAGAQSLVVNSPQTQFNTAIGITTALGGITTDALGTTSLNAGTINASLACHDAVVIGANQTVNGASVVFDSTVDSDPGENNFLKINATTTEFHGSIGSGQPLLDLITDAAGTTRLNAGAITVTRFLTFNDPVTLDVDATLTSLQDVTFNGEVDTADGEFNNLTINADGTTTFALSVGDLHPLGALTVGMSGQTHFVAGQVWAQDAIVINNPVTLSTGGFGDTAVFNGDINVTFASTIDGAISGVQSLAVNSPTTTFDGDIGSVVPLRNITTDAGMQTFLNGSSITTAGGGFQEYNDDVEVGAPHFVFTGHDIRFAGLLDSFAGGGSAGIVVNASGKTEFLQPVGSVTALSSLMTDAVGTTEIKGNITTDNEQIYNDAVALRMDAVLAALNGNVVFSSTVDSGNGENISLTVTSMGNTEFHGAVGAMDALANLTTDEPGSTLIAGGVVTTTGVQVYGDLVALHANTTLAGASVMFAAPVDSDAGANRDLVVNANTTEFSRAIGFGSPLRTLTTDAGGATTFGPMAETVTVVDDISFRDAVVLESSWSFTGGNVTFNSTVDAALSGNAGLFVTTTAGGVITFGDGVGDDDVGAVNALMDVVCNPGSQIVLNAASVNTTGNQQYMGAVVVSTSGTGNANTTLSGRDVSFYGPVDANTSGVEGLIVNTSDGGMTTFGDASDSDDVGAFKALASLTTNADGETLLNSASVTTTGAQQFHDPVRLGTSGVGQTQTVFGGDLIHFVGTLDSFMGGESIAVALPPTGQLHFGGAVGASNPLASISVGSDGTTFFSSNAMNDPTTVTTTGAQAYQNQVKLQGDATLSSSSNGNISLTGGVDSANTPGKNLIINTGGVTEFGGIGATVPLGVLMTDMPGSITINAAFVGLGGPTIFLDPVTLLQDVSMQQLGAGDVVFQNTLDSDATARSLNYLAPQGSSFLFAGDVGGTSPLAFLDGTGELTIAAPLVKTVGSQNYGADVYFDSTSDLETSGGVISFFNVHVIENAHVVVNTGDGPGDIMIDGNAFGDAGGVLETMTLRAGDGDASVRGVVARSIRIIIETAPVIVRQPRGLTVAEGSAFSLSVEAIGSGPLQYEWRKDGNPIPLTFGATLTVPSATSAETGVFSVVVRNDAGSVASDNVTVNVLTPPSIDLQPVAQAVSFGANATFSVTASGSPTLRYQWRFNGQNIPGANSSTLSVNNVRAADLGRYTVIVQNGVGAVTSDPASLSVALPTLDVAQTPEGAVTQTESGASKSVAIPDGETYFMRWQAPDTGVATFDTKGSGYDTRMTVYSGGTLGGLQRIASDDDSGGFLTSEVTFNVVSGAIYTIEITGVEGGFGQLVVNWSFEVSAREAPIIVGQPESASSPFGGTATLTVSATGSEPLSYQWRHNGMDLAGANAASLTVDDIEPADLGQYIVVVSNDVGSVRSRPSHIDAGSDPNAISRPKFENAGGGSPALQLGRGSRQNLVVAAGALGAQVFNNAQSVTEPGEPNHGNAIGGSSRWFEITAAEDGTLLVDTIGSEIDTTMAVYTGSSLANLALVAQDNDGAPDGIRSQLAFPATKDTTYTVAVDGVDGETGLITLNWLLGDPPVIAMAPDDVVVNRLETAAFEVAVTGVPAPTFAWQFQGASLDGATGNTLALPAIEPSDAGIYTVTASNALGSISASAELIVDNPLRFLGAPALQPDGSFAMTLVGPANATAGVSIILEASSDFKTWTQVGAMTSMDGMFDLMEADADGHDARYYRVRLGSGN